MMSPKRIVLANGSRLLREALHRALIQAEHLEVVQEVPDHADLPAVIERCDPQWVILSLPLAGRMRTWMDARAHAHPSLRFIYLTSENNGIQMGWQNAARQDLSNLSLTEFIHILENEPQPL